MWDDGAYKIAGTVDIPTKLLKDAIVEDFKARGLSEPCRIITIGAHQWKVVSDDIAIVMELGDITGPWHVDKSDHNGHYLIKPIPGQIVAEIEPLDNALEIANLIAAAPELLSALETIVENLAESHATEKDAEHYGDAPEECSYCQSIKTAREAIDKAKNGI
jgi:hypothetical protein